MANVNSPFGFKPIGHLSGNTIPEPRPYILTAAQTIYLQDPVIITDAGTVSIAAASLTTTHLGIAAEYHAYGVAGDVIHVWDDPGILFAVQTKTGVTTTISNVFNTADIITYSAGYTTSPYLSRMALDTPGTSSKPWIILGLYNMPNNAWGDSSIVVVKYNQHVFLAPYAGL
jgi:hypothetical protein